MFSFLYFLSWFPLSSLALMFDSPRTLVAKLFSSPSVFTSLWLIMAPALLICTSEDYYFFIFLLDSDMMKIYPRSCNNVIFLSLSLTLTSTFRVLYFFLKPSANSQTFLVSDRSRMWTKTSCNGTDVSQSHFDACGSHVFFFFTAHSGVSHTVLYFPSPSQCRPWPPPPCPCSCTPCGRFLLQHTHMSGHHGEAA